MNLADERIEYLVQGRADEPYRVSFWRVGNDVKSSCTCRAGKSGRACKHRLNLLDGDVTNIVSSSPDSFQQMQSMLEGSDVGEALHAVDSIAPRLHTLEKLLPLKPPGRRKSIAAENLAESVFQGGLIKGNQSHYDVYSSALSYVGSVKARRGTVFSEKTSRLFS